MSAGFAMDVSRGASFSVEPPRNVEHLGGTVRLPWEVRVDRYAPVHAELRFADRTDVERLRDALTAALDGAL